MNSGSIAAAKLTWEKLDNRTKPTRRMSSPVLGCGDDPGVRVEDSWLDHIRHQIDVLDQACLWAPPTMSGHIRWIGGGISHEATR